MELERRGTGNGSWAIEFQILGFSEFPELQLPLFTIFTLMFLLAVLGNLVIIYVICANQHLHSPMYFFLANLSALDISSLTVTVPKLLGILLIDSKGISFSQCILQMYCFLSLTGVEFLLLTAMAFDRYVAICHPLRYTMIMSKRVCTLLAAGSWTAGFLEIMSHAVVISRFSFCDSTVIDHIFCDLMALMKLSCSDTSVIEMMNFAEGGFTAFIPCLLTLTSYGFIISAILRIRSTAGRRKAFSTCSSHLMVVIMSYGTMLEKPRDKSSLAKSLRKKIIINQ
ncbi:olfactory receptor 8D4-like [Rhinatrema bivittatum]|uniref:olfactory receptor 8D4-like n=1 Tax=Rhinatrema bivittatum TaxID=194408 RepID=UPI00112A817F|nr:olfactory receptor 8D4-like [Rhinatrema bivittatum]